MFERIVTAFRSTPNTQTRNPRRTAAPVGIEAMESRMLMSVAATAGTFTITFQGQTTSAAQDGTYVEELSLAGGNTQAILIGLLLPAVQKVR